MDEVKIVVAGQNGETQSLQEQLEKAQKVRVRHPSGSRIFTSEKLRPDVGRSQEIHINNKSIIDMSDLSRTHVPTLRTSPVRAHCMLFLVSV